MKFKFLSRGIKLGNKHFTLSILVPFFNDKIELYSKGEGVVVKEFRIADRDRKKQPVAGVRVVNGEFDRFTPYFFLLFFVYICLLKLNTNHFQEGNLPICPTAKSQRSDTLRFDVSS